MLGQYLYVRNNTVNWIVPFGLSVHPNNYIRWDEARSIVHEGKTYYSAYDILYNKLGATFTKNDNDTAEKHSFSYFGAEVVLKFITNNPTGRDNFIYGDLYVYKTRSSWMEPHELA